MEVAADADADAGRYLGGCDFHDGIAEGCAFAARYDDIGVGHE